jgi:hypothetical protein
MDYTKDLNKLFKAAKANDEFEYACALLNFQGVQDEGWDPLQETIYLYEDLTGLLAAPLKPDTRARLALLLYCHLTEAEAIYRVIYNMLRITQGNRYSAFPFEPLVRKFKNGDRIEPTVRKIVSEIDNYSQEIGFNEIGNLAKYCVNHELRNAFYHSDYNLHNGEFRSKGSWFVHADNVRSQVLSNEELTTIINAGIGFFQSFMTVYMKHRRSYRANKVVQGRLTHDDSYIPITLTAKRPEGLYGFQSIGGYDDPAVAAK